MTDIPKFARVGVQFFLITLVALALAGCVTTCVDCAAKTCDNSGGNSANFGFLPDGSNPVSCPSIAIDVTTANQPSGCIVNPGVSKKCASTTSKCPHDILGPYLCKTKVGTGGNCSCTCNGT
jgi:hypothetical protein